MELLDRIATSLQEGDDEQVAALTREALDAGQPPQEILNEGLIAGMDVVSRRFGKREIFLPDVLLASKAMVAGLELLQPLLEEAGGAHIGKAVIGTVQGDLHDIGKNLVGVMLKGAGIDVIDLGNDVAPERFVEAAKESGARIIGMSALLTTTMTGMRKVVELVRAEDLEESIRIIVGGAPVTEDFARDIGADAYSYDGAHAVDKVKSLLEGFEAEQ
jgi:5-methyltetrahydrofolate--homocysteine methyltransferase